MLVSDKKEDLRFLDLEIYDENKKEKIVKYINVNNESLRGLSGDGSVNVNQYFFKNKGFIYYNPKGKWLKTTISKVDIIAKLFSLTNEEAILLTFGMFKELNGEKDFNLEDVISKIGSNEEDVFHSTNKKSIKTFYKYFNLVNELLELDIDAKYKDDNIVKFINMYNELAENYFRVCRNFKYSFSEIPTILDDENVFEVSTMEKVINVILENSNFYNTNSDDLKEKIKLFLKMNYILSVEEMSVKYLIDEGLNNLNNNINEDMRLTMDVMSNRGNIVRYGNKFNIKYYSVSKYKLNKDKLGYFIKMYDGIFTAKQLTKSHLLNNMIRNKNGDKVRSLFDKNLKDKSIERHLSLLLNDLDVFNEIKSDGMSEQLFNILNKDLNIKVSSLFKNSINIEDLKELTSNSFNIKFDENKRKLTINKNRGVLKDIIQMYMNSSNGKYKISVESIYDAVVDRCYKDFGLDIGTSEYKSELKEYKGLMLGYINSYIITVDDVINRLDSINYYRNKFELGSQYRDVLGSHIYEIGRRLDKQYLSFSYNEYSEDIYNIVEKSCRLLEKIVKFNLSQSNQTVLYNNMSILERINKDDYCRKVLSVYNKMIKEKDDDKNSYDKISKLSFDYMNQDLDNKLSKSVLELFGYTRNDNQIYKREFLNRFGNGTTSFNIYYDLTKRLDDKNLILKNINDVYISEVLTNYYNNYNFLNIVELLKGKDVKDNVILKIIRYIYGDCITRQCLSSRDALGYYKDYVNMYINLVNKGMREIEDFIAEPYSLKLEHDIIGREYQTLRQEFDEESFNKAYKDEDILNLTKLNLTENSRGKNKRKVKLIRPIKSDDVIVEGKNLSHCVGSYVSSILNGRVLIYFLRLEDSLDKSYCTVEVVKVKDGYSLGQVKLRNNRAYHQSKVRDKIKNRIDEVNRKIMDDKVKILSRG